MDDTYRGELQRQGDAVEAAADLGDRTGAVGIEDEVRRGVLRPLDEQLDGLQAGQPLGRVVGCRQLQRRHPPGDLARLPQRLPARGDDHQIGAARQQLGRQRHHRVEHVLAVVEDDQGRARRQLVDEGADPRLVAFQRDAQRTADGRRDVVAVRHAGQLHEPHAVRPAGTRQLTVGELDGQAGLACAARAGEREQAGPVEESVQLGELPVPADEAGRQRGQVVRARARIGRATDEQPPMDADRRRRRADPVLLVEAVAQALEGGDRIPASPGPGEGDEQRPVQFLVERSRCGHRLEQGDGVVGPAVGQQGAGQVRDEADADGVEAIAVRCRPILVEVLGEELTRPHVQCGTQVVDSTGRARSCGRVLELVDVHADGAVTAELDDVVGQDEVRRADDPACGVQGLMEVVGAHRRIGIRPQLVDQDVAMEPMSRPQGEELDEGLRLAQSPRRRHDRAVDDHREPAEERDPHGRGGVAHPRMLPARCSIGKPDRAAVPRKVVAKRRPSRCRPHPRTKRGRHDSAIQ